MSELVERLNNSNQELKKSNDCISRQAAIDAMINSRSNADVTLVPGSYTNGWRDGRKLLLDELLQVVFELPSAQPEPNYDEWCTDCKEYDQEQHCCPRWNRVIRQTLKDAQPEQPSYVAEIEEEYQKAVKSPYIHKPLAKALYEVWKKHDREDAERRTDE